MNRLSLLLAPLLIASTVHAAEPSPSAPPVSSPVAPPDSQPISPSDSSPAAPPREPPRAPFDRGAAEARFADLFVGFGRADVRANEEANDAKPYLGVLARKPLALGSLYDAIERPDMAARYRARSRLRIALTIAGAIPVLLGATAIALGQYSYNNSSSDEWNGTDYVYVEHPERDHSLAGQITGGILIGAGAVALFTALFLPQHPMNVGEAREAADRHNLEVRRRLGLAEPAPPDAPPQSPAPAPPASELLIPRLQPYAGRAGGGLQLAWIF